MNEEEAKCKWMFAHAPPLTTIQLKDFAGDMSIPHSNSPVNEEKDWDIVQRDVMRVLVYEITCDQYVWVGYLQGLLGKFWFSCLNEFCNV